MLFDVISDLTEVVEIPWDVALVVMTVLTHQINIKLLNVDCPSQAFFENSIQHLYCGNGLKSLFVCAVWRGVRCGLMASSGSSCCYFLAHQLLLQLKSFRQLAVPSLESCDTEYYHMTHMWLHLLFDGELVACVMESLFQQLYLRLNSLTLCKQVSLYEYR